MSGRQLDEHCNHKQVSLGAVVGTLAVVPKPPATATARTPHALRMKVNSATANPCLIARRESIGLPSPGQPESSGSKVI